MCAKEDRLSGVDFQYIAIQLDHTVVRGTTPIRKSANAHVMLDEDVPIPLADFVAATINQVTLHSLKELVFCTASEVGVGKLWSSRLHELSGYKSVWAVHKKAVGIGTHGMDDGILVHGLVFNEGPGAK